MIENGRVFGSSHDRGRNYISYQCRCYLNQESNVNGKPDVYFHNVECQRIRDYLADEDNAPDVEECC